MPRRTIRGTTITTTILVVFSVSLLGPQSPFCQGFHSAKPPSHLQRRNSRQHVQQLTSGVSLIIRPQGIVNRAALRSRVDPLSSNDNNDTTSRPTRGPPRRRKFFGTIRQKGAALRKKLSFQRRGDKGAAWKRRLSVAAAALLGSTLLLDGASKQSNNVAHAASAPVMALPKAEGRDPATEAMQHQERKNAAQAQQELNDMAKKARQIEAEQGEAARVQFEKEYKLQQEQRAQERVEQLETLKRDLLKSGIDPFCDMEGQRQVALLKTGVDLGKVQGTPFFLEKEWERKASKKSFAIQKAPHRQVIKCMVQDMENRDIDSLEYFSKHQDQTEALLDLPVARANQLATMYSANLEQYGQIVPPKEGELSAKEKLAMKEKNDPSAKQRAKEQAKAEKAQRKAEQARLKAEAKAEKQRLKEEAKRAKQEAKVEAQRARQAAKEEEDAANRAKEAAVAAAAAAAAGAAGSAAAMVGDAASVAQDAAKNLMDSTTATAPSGSEIQGSSLFPDSGEESTGGTMFDGEQQQPPSSSGLQEQQTGESSSKLKIVPAVAAIAVAGGGGFALKLYQDKKAADEEERQRQFRLLMGETVDGDKNDNASALESIDAVVVDDVDDKPTTKKKAESEPPVDPPSTTAPSPVVEQPKKKGLGIKRVFGKKKNSRETDIMALVQPNAQAPQFTQTLSKLLTFGAPGRFPGIVALPGGMPMEKFELEAAKEKLIEAQAEAGLTLEESAEIFANVVNCMLIDIIDLASTSLKEKDDKVTVSAIDIVVDFMNHAASMYDSIAEGVILDPPVTYGGDLGKSKLEQMFSTYASSGLSQGMMGMMGGTGDDGDDGANAMDDFDSRVAMIQDVFQINAKRAEGLMTKAMQKQLMSALKDGKGLEGMGDMMKGMEGMEGLLGGENGEEMDPEQLKEMLKTLKQLKDSGEIPPAEFEEVKKQFSDAFGSSIDDVVRDANDNQDEISETDKELLDLMKDIMGEK